MPHSNKKQEQIITKLNEYLDKDEEIKNKNKKELNKLRLDNETMKREKDCNDQKVEKLERSLSDYKERLQLLQSTYDYAKRLNEDRQQWGSSSSKRKSKRDPRDKDQ